MLSYTPAMFMVLALARGCLANTERWTKAPELEARLEEFDGFAEVCKLWALGKGIESICLASFVLWIRSWQRVRRKA